MTSVRARPSPLPGWLEAGVILAADQLFEWVRTQLTGSASAAQHNARDIVRLERWTWTLHEHRLQQWVLGNHYLVEGLDIFYGTIHFVVPPLVLVVLWRHWPQRYAKWRNAIVACTLLSLACFALYPLAPPRLFPSLHLTDTARTIGGLGPLDAGNFKDRNPYAAMPSLHLAWSTWCACALASISQRQVVKAAWFIYPAITLVVVMATANHWFLDAVGGWAVLGVGWLAAAALQPRKRTSSGADAPAPDDGRDQDSDEQGGAIEDVVDPVLDSSQ